MFGSHDALSSTRAAHYVLLRSSVLVGTPLLILAAAPMLLILLPLAFAGLPFLLVSFLAGASSNHMESRRIEAWHQVGAHA